MKIALIYEEPLTDLNSWYVKVEDVTTPKEAGLFSVKLNHVIERIIGTTNSKEYITGAWLNEKDFGIRIPKPIATLDIVYKMFKECGYLLRTVFSGPYCINPKKTYIDDLDIYSALKCNSCGFDFDADLDKNPKCPKCTGISFSRRSLY